MSGGIKPGSGVDLQVEKGTDVQLYAIQSSPNTKNSGSRASDVAALKRAALPLRAARRHVELGIAVLSGRPKTGRLRAEPEIEVVGSDEFWKRVSGIDDFRARLLAASLILGRLIRVRATDEVERIRREAQLLFGGDDGTIDLGALSSPRVEAPAGAIDAGEE